MSLDYRFEPPTDFNDVQYEEVIACDTCKHNLENCLKAGGCLTKYSPLKLLKSEYQILNESIKRYNNSNEYNDKFVIEVQINNNYKNLLYTFHYLLNELELNNISKLVVGNEISKAIRKGDETGDYMNKHSLKILRVCNELFEED